MTADESQRQYRDRLIRSKNAADSRAWHRSRKNTFPGIAQNGPKPLAAFRKVHTENTGKYTQFRAAACPLRAPGRVGSDHLEAVLIRVAVVDEDRVEAGDAGPPFDGGNDGLVVSHLGLGLHPPIEEAAD